MSRLRPIKGVFWDGGKVWVTGSITEILASHENKEVYVFKVGMIKPRMIEVNRSNCVFFPQPPPYRPTLVIALADKIAQTQTKALVEEREINKNLERKVTKQENEVEELYNEIRSLRKAKEKDVADRVDILLEKMSKFIKAGKPKGKATTV